jgi:amphi-Trp domain-containing protein
MSHQHETDDHELDHDDDVDTATESDKPKKTKIKFASSMPRDEAVAYFEAIAAGLKSGKIDFHQGDETVTLTAPERLDVEVKAVSKGDKARVHFELSWRVDATPGLTIVPS